MNRIATVTWKGAGKEGHGSISTQSGALNKVHYAWSSRFENASGTNPEELIAAAHAACFTMKLSFVLAEAGFPPEIIETSAKVTLEKDSISHSHIITRATVHNISNQKFEECADKAIHCIVSRVLNAAITMEATLTESTMA
jgi:osmotically inducible protein OsmC